MIDALADRFSRGELAIAVAASASSALLLWAASPAVGFGWVGWVALVPAAAAALRSPGRLGRLVLPLTFGLYLELLLVPGLPLGLARDQWADEPIVPILVADSPVVVVALVLVPAAATILYAVRFPQPLPRELAWRASAVPLLVVPALVWTALDVLRAKFDPGGLWGPLFLSQHDQPTSAVAALAGPWLLSALLIAVNYSLALVFVGGRHLLRAAAGALALVSTVVGAGMLLDAPPAQGSFTVAAVQPGYDTADFDLPVMRHFRRESRDYERAALDLIRDLDPLTREAGRRGAELVLWPEAAVWVDPRRSPSVRRALTLLAREADVTVVVPYFLRARAQGAAVAFRRDGTATEPHAKRRPMWFVGEDGGNRRAARPLRAGRMLVGTLLGVDNQDPAAPRTLAALGAEVLVASTHDWRELAPHQRAYSRLHSAALGVPFVRADWRYGSGIFERGKARADAGTAKRRAVVVAAVAPTRATPYSRFGDAFAWVAVAVAGALVLTGATLRLIGRASAG